MSESCGPFSNDCAAEFLREAKRVWQRCASGAESQVPADEAARGVPPTVRDFQTITEYGTLHLTLPGIEVTQFCRWLGLRLVWIPTNELPTRKISLVSSRVGDRLDQRTGWFDALRTAVIRCDRRNEHLSGW